MRHLSLILASLALLVVAGCDVGPNGYGTAPAGVSQAEWDARIAAKRKAEWNRHARGSAGRR